MMVKLRKNKWLTLASVASGAFLASMDSSIVNIALPTLVKDLGTDFTHAQWVVLSYLLVLTSLILPIGRLGDMMGKKKIYLAGFIIFTAGSFLCGQAEQVISLVGARIVQAVGGAMIMALGLAIVAEVFSPAERGKAIGIISSVIAVAIALGPTVGGFLIDLYSWHWIFFVNLPVGILGILLVGCCVFPGNTSKSERFDYPAAVLLFILLLCLLSALSMGQKSGFGNIWVILLCATSAICLFLFLQVERKTVHPIVDFTLFKNQLFSINLLTGLVSFVAYAGVVILLPFYLENILGYTVRNTGMMMTIVPIMLGILSPVSGALSDRFGPRPVSVAGLGLLLFAYYMATSLTGSTTVNGYVFRVILIGGGMGFFMAPNNTAMMGAVPRDRLGITSGLVSVSRTLGQTLGVAVIGAFWISRTLHYTRNTQGPEGRVDAQVFALHDAFLLVVAMIFCALVLSVSGMIQEKRQREKAKRRVRRF